MAAFDDLTDKLAAAPGLEAALDILVTDLARRIKATSNDQNIQKLARELRAESSAIVAAIARKQVALTDG